MSSNNHIVFGTGPLGLAVMDALVSRGKNVTMVNRKGQVSETLPPGVKVISGNATQAAEVARLTAGAEVVYHCAQPGYTTWPTEFPPITRGILDGVTQSGAKLVFGDNLYMYGPTQGKPIHENLPYAATGHKGKTRAEMAKWLLEAHQTGKVRVTIGRASDFYGPRVLGSALGDRAFEAALAGKTVDVLGNIDLPHTYSYIKDFGQGLVTLGEHDAALGQAWHIPNPPTLTTRQMIDLIAQAVGKPIKTRAAGRLILYVMGLFNPMLREFKEMMYEFEEPYIVDSTQFIKAFGDLSTPHQTAIEATVAWYRQKLKSH